MSENTSFSLSNGGIMVYSRMQFLSLLGAKYGLLEDCLQDKNSKNFGLVRSLFQRKNVPCISEIQEILIRLNFSRNCSENLHHIILRHSVEIYSIFMFHFDLEKILEINRQTDEYLPKIFSNPDDHRLDVILLINKGLNNYEKSIVWWVFFNNFYKYFRQKVK